MQSAQSGRPHSGLTRQSETSDSTPSNAAGNGISNSLQDDEKATAKELNGALNRAERLYNAVGSVEGILRSICLESRKKSAKGMFSQLKQGAEKAIVMLRGIHELYEVFARDRRAIQVRIGELEKAIAKVNNK